MEENNIDELENVDNFDLTINEKKLTAGGKLHNSVVNGEYFTIEEANQLLPKKHPEKENKCNFYFYYVKNMKNKHLACKDSGVTKDILRDWQKYDKLFEKGLEYCDEILNDYIESMMMFQTSKIPIYPIFLAKKNIAKYSDKKTFNSPLTFTNQNNYYIMDKKEQVEQFMKLNKQIKVITKRKNAEDKIE